jgi:Xaa-Pro aminopeptidase
VQAPSQPDGPGVISDAELAERRARLHERASALGSNGFVLFSPDYLHYFTGFWFLSNERPIVYAEAASGEGAIFVPEFEVERTKAEASFERIESYPEFPGLEHPMKHLVKVLADLGLTATIAADNDGYPGILGYTGPTLGSTAGATVVDLAGDIESMMLVKSPAEIELIRESSRWCAHAHRLLERYTRVGSTEAEASLQAQMETTLAMLREHGSRGLLGSGDGAKAGYRGQIGLRSSWAHAIAHNIEFQRGDVLVSETGAPVWGYQAELERAMVIGPPTDRQRLLFDHMVASQQAAFDAIRPGATCAQVDDAVMRYLEEHDLLAYWRQHTGHGTGLRNHEAPFIDVGVQMVLEPGMVFTVEPGVYDPEVGGFRHSDTVVVTDEGFEKLTDYPRDLDSLTLPA